MASSTTVWTFNIGGTEIAIVEVLRNLGALRDNELNAIFNSRPLAKVQLP